MKDGESREKRGRVEIRISFSGRLEELHGSRVLFEVCDAHKHWQLYMCLVNTCHFLHSCLCVWG